MLVAACLWYLVLTSVLLVGQYYLERHFARGSARSERAPAAAARHRRRERRQRERDGGR